MSDDLSFLALGANLHTFTVAGLPLVVSLPTEDAYISTGNPAYFGETIGRLGNRLKEGALHLNGVTYQLARNNGSNTLHGGPRGWGKQRWSGPHPESRHGAEAVRFTLRSPDGDEGFPGAVIANAWYIGRRDESTGGMALEVEYEVTWDPEGPTKGQQGEQLSETVVNVTNHTAFSVAPVPQSTSDSRSLAGTKATLFTNLRQEVDEAAIPTGRITTHPGITPGAPFTLSADKPVFDDCFVLKAEVADVPLDTRGGDLQKLCAFEHPDTGLHLEAWSTEPAFQFYTGEFIDLNHKDEKGKEHKYAKRAGFCVEASRFVDAPSRPEWKGMVVLPRGKTWGSRTVYKAWKQ
ncbi:putative aldose 1-epimerase [Myriangium duriaei CBS 260.36]|uniref:Aldose 1-epimerase n=1 Tax=Myriangium duriaei CBS 260.36 TaxID=1168546 RepID=A0A9P4J9F6_9PEZI|nr:putative aldose 1-epimerase [Myriangium duriaei CBS 260.36]